MAIPLIGRGDAMGLRLVLTRPMTGTAAKGEACDAV
jgi:hypothetical protein